jgi:hypothetical protein
MPNGKQIKVDDKIYILDVEDGKWYELKEVKLSQLSAKVQGKMLEALSLELTKEASDMRSSNNA